MKNIFTEIQKLEEEFVKIRHKLHEYPEIGFEEHKTSDFVAEKLTEWGYEVHRGLATTGVVGTLKIGNGSKRLGLRADMDALPLQENNDLEWKSKIPNRMHACGHDGHTAILLTAAKYLANERNFSGTLHLFFQPAEELLYGGKKMIDDGLFELFPCDAIFGLHNMPGLKKGEFYFRKGAYMASSDTLEIEVQGVGGHGAWPHETIDTTLVAAHIAVTLQSIVSRNVNPQEAAVITVGSIQSGEVANVIPNNAIMKLSVRALNPDIREKVLKRIGEIAVLQAETLGAKATVHHLNACPVLMNDEKMSDYVMGLVAQLFGEDACHDNATALMGSEDFAFMLEANPNGCYFFVGSGDGSDVYKLHNPRYDFNDDIIIPAATLWAALANDFLS